MSGVVEGRLADGRAVRVEVQGARIGAVTAVDRVPERVILAGLVDVQVNGYAGIDVNADGCGAGDIGRLVRALWGRGVTSVVPTVVTGPEERIVAALRAVVAARAADPLVRHSVVGVHVEGPYLSEEDGPRGAHDARYLRDPDLGEFERWQAAAGGLVRIVTLAPERAGALEYIAGVTRRGVVASVGHTAADGDRIRAAAAAGARLSTHLGNGTHATVRRHPNHLWAQLAEDRLAASLIADGHHLPADTFTVMLRAKGAERVVLVSDSVALAGCPPGDYTTPVGGAVTVHPDGRLTLAGSELLAGSGRSLLDCVEWATTTTTTAGLDLPTASRLAAANPARLLGLTDRGEIVPGAYADLVTVTREPSGRLVDPRTYLRGRLVAG